MPVQRRVALLIDTSTDWGRRLIRGIADYSNEHGPWVIHVEPRGRYERLRPPKNWKGNGIIARVTNKELARDLYATGIPCVNLSWMQFDEFPIPRCTTSDQETARIAVEHLQAKGFKNFAFCGDLYRHDQPDCLQLQFERMLKEIGASCHVCPAPTFRQTEALHSDTALLLEWLKELPKPIAILAWSASRGRQVTEACHYAGIRIPDEVAVLGGDGDFLMSEISTPSLSTIVHAGRQIGYSSAAMLEGMMRGDPPPSETLYFPPSGVRARQSTDYMAAEDEWVVSSLKYIQANACKGIHVGDILKQVPISRRSLEQNLVQSIGRTPSEEIRRVRIEKAKQLLLETELSTAQIAKASGFGQQQILSRTFRKFVGYSPTEFRKLHRM